MTKDYVERVEWETVKQDTQANHDNDGYAFGLNFIDFENEGDILDVMWFKTIEERDAEITNNKYTVVFDE